MPGLSISQTNHYYEDDAVKSLIKTMESYTNGGLILIKEKIEDNPNYFLQPTSFLNLILVFEKT